MLTRHICYINNWFQIKYEQLQRMIFWGWNMRNSYDFDGGTVYKVLNLKLKRMYDCFLKDGHLMWNNSPDTRGMRLLIECIELTSRLQEDYHRNYEVVCERYMTPPRTKCSFLEKFHDDMYPNAKPIDRAMYRHFLSKAFDKDSSEQKRDKARLFKLLEKHLDSWWD